MSICHPKLCKAAGKFAAISAPGLMCVSKRNWAYKLSNRSVYYCVLDAHHSCIDLPARMTSCNIVLCIQHKGGSWTAYLVCGLQPY